MNDLDSRDSTSRNYKQVGIRPPVIGQENTSSSSEDAISSRDTSILMQSNPNTRPPTLPPKPRIGSGVPLIRGPPPPVQPRSSSLQATHQNSATGSQELCSDETDQRLVQPSAFLANEDNSVVPSSVEAVMVASTLKCDTKTFEDNLSSPQPGKSLGSESSRGFEPEGKFSKINHSDILRVSLFLISENFQSNRQIFFWSDCLICCSVFRILRFGIQ